MPFRSVLVALLVVSTAIPLRAQRIAVEAEHGMVTSVDGRASAIGTEILKKGGNAVDAAIATGFALAVVYPSAGNIAGGGFMLIHLAREKREVVIDFKETTPAMCTADMFIALDGSIMNDMGSSRLGYRASGVPGTIAGFATAFKKYGSGKVTWAELIEPARKLAEEGHVLTPGVLAQINENVARLSRFEESKREFLNGGAGKKAGELWRRQDLAATLARLQANGPREFYEGVTAHRIADAMAANGGTITLDDLKNYQAAERTPLRQSYRGYEIVVPPPPSSGGLTLLEILGMIEPYDVRSLGQDSAAKYHLFAEAARRAFRDRIEYIGDPDFMELPLNRLLDRKYFRSRMADFDPNQATPSKNVQPGLGSVPESHDTTHFSVVDAEGNAVANTYTIRDDFGSAVVIPGTGLVMNDVMDNLAAKVGVANSFGLVIGEANAIRPGRRSASSQTPTMVFKDGKLLLVTGTVGGPTIINTVLQVITNVIDFQMPVMQAVEAPRINHQWMPDQIEYEKYRMSLDTIKALEARGHKVVIGPEPQGDAETIMIDPVTNRRLGAADLRRPDVLAVGY